MKAESIESGGRIIAADGLKGLAILGVIFTHTVGRTLVPGTAAIELYGYDVSPLTWLINARVAVSFFFVLSGFLLALTYAQGTRSMESKQDILRFYKARAMRLLPLYYLVLGVSGIAAAFLVGEKEALTYTIMLGSFVFPFLNWYPGLPRILAPAFGPLWYVGTLFWLVILFPFIIRCVNRWGICRVLIAGIVLNTFVRFAGSWTANSELILLTYRLRLDEFVLGIALAYGIQEGKERVPVGVALFTGILGLTMGFTLKDAVVLGDIAPMALVISSFLMAVGAAIIVNACLRLSVGLQRVFFPSFLRLIGRVSYPLYLIHGVLILLLGQPDRTGTLRFIVLLALFTAAAHALLPGNQSEASMPKNPR